MAQTKLGSFLESCTNTVISFLTAMIVGHFLYPLFGFRPSVSENAAITFVFLMVSMIRSYVIRRWFNKLSSHPAPAPVEYEPVVLSNQQIHKGIKLIRHRLLEDLREFTIDDINRVQCPIKFPGWGYIAGKTKGWWINNELQIVEGDSDLHNSELCIVVKGKAAILIECRLEQIVHDSMGWITRLWVITPEFADTLLMPSGIKFESVEDFEALPGPVQRVMMDVLDALLTRERGRYEEDPTDAILEYKQ